MTEIYWDPIEPSLRDDPYPLWKRMRDEAPPEARPAEAQAVPASAMVPEPAVGGAVALAPPKAVPPKRAATPAFRAAPQAEDEVAEDAGVPAGGRRSIASGGSARRPWRRSWAACRSARRGG